MLYASCSAEFVYEVIGYGADANDALTLDLRVMCLNDVVHFGHDDTQGSATEPDFRNPLTRLELPDGVSLVMRDVQYRQVGEGFGGVARIVVNGPEGGCHRCCYLFGVYEGKDLNRPVRG